MINSPRHHQVGRRQVDFGVLITAIPDHHDLIMNFFLPTIASGDPIS